MKWLIILCALAAAAAALQVLIRERRSGRRGPTTPGRIALAVLTVALMGGAVYSAHLLGIFSIPLVVIAFVPVGVTLRWLILATRDSRQRAEEVRAASMPPATRRERLLGAASLPILVVLMAAVAFLAVVVGTVVGRQ